MKIAVLGWGSLIWNPEVLRVYTKWRQGPALPIEFARKSRGDRVTLVLVPGYPHTSRVFWAMSECGNIYQACDDLQQREGRCKAGDVHYTTGGTLRTGRDEEPSPNSADVSKAVADWLELTPALDAAVWTGLPPKGFDRLEPAGLATDVVEFLRDLPPTRREGAKKYVQLAPSSIRTPVRHAIEQSPLRWLPRELPGSLFDSSDS